MNKSKQLSAVRNYLYTVFTLLMKKVCTLSWLVVLGFLSCQKELHFPPVPPVVIEKVVASVVITDPSQIDYDSLVFRYQPDKIREVHYSRAARDSITRTYSYDEAGRLSAIEDEKAIYYTNNDRAKSIRFIYNDNGELTQTLTDFTTVSGIAASYVNGISGNTKTITVYDTAYSGASYNLQWVNRIIYNTLTNDNYLLYDSCRSLNKFSGIIKTQVSRYSYTADKNVYAINFNTYFDDEPAEAGITTLERDKVAPVFESLRKKIYCNLANWYEAGFVSQDDNYRLFTVPGHLYKSMAYSGHSLSLAPIAPVVTRNYDYVNSLNGDLLQKTVFTYSVGGQGNARYTKVLRYYYR